MGYNNMRKKLIEKLNSLIQEWIYDWRKTTAKEKVDAVFYSLGYLGLVSFLLLLVHCFIATLYGNEPLSPNVIKTGRLLLILSGNMTIAAIYFICNNIFLFFKRKL